MKKFLRKIIILIVIIVLLIPPFNFFFSASRGFTYHSLGEMYESKENIDLVYIGASCVFRGFVPQIANKMLGCKTFNAGSSSQGMNTSYYFLREINQYHKLKTVFLDTFYIVANLADDDAQVFTISDHMKFGLNKIRLLYSNGGIETVINGLLKFRRGNFDVIGNVRSHFVDYKDYSNVRNKKEAYVGDGYVYSYGVALVNDEKTYSHAFKQPEAQDLRAEVPVSKLYLKSLIQIIEYCRANNIKIILISQPVPRKTLSYAQGYNNYIQFFKKIAEKYDVEYWNFDLYKYDHGITPDCYTDGGHLNGDGAKKYTTFLCNFINGVKSGKIVPKEMFYEAYEK